MSSVLNHRKICQELVDIYAKKNADYGDSFHKSFEEEGWAMIRIRLGDKFSRLKNLTRGNSPKVSDESLRDTLMDLANYAIMSVMELDNELKQKGLSDCEVEKYGCEEG